MKKNEKITSTKIVWIIILFIFLLIIGSSLYTNYRITKLTQQFDIKLVEFNNNLIKIDTAIKNNNAQISNLRDNISSIDSNLNQKIRGISSDLENTQSKHQKQIETINSMISEIEEQSNIRLDEVKDELKSIKVKSKDFSGIVEDVLQSVVSISTNKGQGSGAVIDTEGFIVTNYHVIGGTSKVKVLTYERDVLTGNVIGYDNDLDIAVIKVDAELKQLRFADSDKVKVGERVIALGSPAGLSFTVTEGIISATKRKGPSGLPIYIQTDVPLNPGNSGGPLVNTEGKIIGINNYKIGDYESLGFALESNIVKKTTDKIIDDYLEEQE